MTPNRRDVVKYGIVGLATAVGVTGVGSARPDKNNGKGNNEARANFPDQTVEAEDGTVEVSVKQAFLPDGGFVVIHNETLLQGAVVPSIVGKSEALGAGGHGDVDIEVPVDGIVDADGSGETELIAMPHRDTNDNGSYDFPDDTSEDVPYFVGNDPDNGPVIDAAVVTVE